MLIHNKINSKTAKLIIKIQKFDSAWQDYSTPVNQQVTIPVNNLIKLDAIFNNLNVKINEAGSYRVYTALTSNDGIVLKDLEGNNIESTYNFQVV